MILDVGTPRRSVGRRFYQHLPQLIYCSSVCRERTAWLKKPGQCFVEPGMLWVMGYKEGRLTALNWGGVHDKRGPNKV